MRPSEAASTPSTGAVQPHATSFHGYRICPRMLRAKSSDQPERFRLRRMEISGRADCSTLRASLRRMAMLSGPWSRRLRARSSSKATSSTQCRLFSIRQGRAHPWRSARRSARRRRGSTDAPMWPCRPARSRSRPWPAWPGPAAPAHRDSAGRRTARIQPGHSSTPSQRADTRIPHAAWGKGLDQSDAIPVGAAMPATASGAGRTGLASLN